MSIDYSDDLIISQQNLIHIPMQVDSDSYEITTPQPFPGNEHLQFSSLSLRTGDSVLWEIRGLQPGDRPVIVYEDVLAGHPPFKRVFQHGHMIIGHEFGLPEGALPRLQKRHALQYEHSIKEALEKVVKLSTTTSERNAAMALRDSYRAVDLGDRQTRIGYRISVVKADGIAVQLPYAYGSGMGNQDTRPPLGMIVVAD